MNDVLKRLENAELVVKQIAHICDSGRAREHLELALAHLKAAYVAHNDGDERALSPSAVHSSVMVALRMFAEGGGRPVKDSLL